MLLLHCGWVTKCYLVGNKMLLGDGIMVTKCYLKGNKMLLCNGVVVTKCYLI